MSEQKKYIKAWDELYKITGDKIWGDRPVPIVEDFIKDAPLDFCDNFKTLDAATGEGRNLEILLKFPGEIIACDASQHALNKISLELDSRVKKVLCEISDMPFDDEYFDFILAWDFFETQMEPNTALKEIYRVMKKNGLLLCNIPDLDDDIAEIDMEPLDNGRYLYQGKYFYRYMDRKAVETLLKKNALVIVKSSKCQWEEDGHFQFREGKHGHTSNVFLIRKINE